MGCSNRQCVRQEAKQEAPPTSTIRARLMVKEAVYDLLVSLSRLLAQRLVEVKRQ